MVGIVLSDLDGTLLAHDKSLPERNLRALDRLARLDIPFVPCSGRSLAAIPRAIASHSSCRYAICSNGAVVEDVSSAETLHVAPLDRGRCLALYERVRDRDVTFDLFADGRILSERRRYERMGSYGIEEHELRAVRQARTPVEALVPELLGQVGRLERVTVFWGRPEDRAYVISCVEADPTLAWTTSSPHDLEISDRSASKGAALSWLCDHLGIARADSLAFGDMLNDLSMLRAAGDGVAVANAHPDLLAVADHVTSSNDEGGVGAYLERVLP